MSERALLASAGLDPARCALRPMGRGWLCESWDVTAPTGRFVLKTCATGLADRIHGDDDPRFRTLARLFPVAPLLRPLAAAVGPVRAALGDRAPRVVAEARDAAAGIHRVLLTRLPGRPMTTDPEPDAVGPVASERIGALTRRLHAATAVPAADFGGWCADLAEALHGLADAVDGGPELALHRRLVPLLQRFENRAPRRFAHVHGDLHPTNLLVDDRGHIRGVVDFELSGVAPAALDLRWLALLDEARFAAGYGLDAADLPDACWLGHFVDLVWQTVRVGVGLRYGAQLPTAIARAADRSQLEYLLRLCEDEALRQGPAGARIALRRELRARQAECAVARRPRAPRGVRLGVVIAARDHYATTTGPCLDAIRRFTDVPYRVVVVDDASCDRTPVELERLAARDERVRVCRSATSRGWATASLRGLDALGGWPSEVVLLNSDTVVTPGWVAGLVDAARASGGFAVADEPRPAVALPPLGRPGSRPPPAATPLAEVLAWAAARARDRRGPRSEEGPPSGFCLLFGAALRDVVAEYLQRFDEFFAGAADWHGWWTARGLRCRVARDVSVHHARGGSGGYYPYGD